MVAALGALVVLGACVSSVRPERFSTRSGWAAGVLAVEDPAWPPHGEFPEPQFYSRQPEVRRADALLDAKRYADAVAAYDEALAVFPDNPYALANRANAKRRLGRLPDAIADYTKALELRPDYTLALHNRGYARRLAGDLQGARADLDAALRIGARGFSSYTWSRTLTYRVRGDTRRLLGDLEGARADYEAALRYEGEAEGARINQVMAKVESGAVAPEASAAEIERLRQRDRERAERGRAEVEALLGEGAETPAPSERPATRAGSDVGGW